MRGTLEEVLVCKNGTGSYMSINEAVKDIGNKAIIYVKPGIYEESILIEQDVTLVGAGNPEAIIIQQKAAPCLIARASRIRIKGISLKSTGKALSFSKNRKDMETIFVQAGALCLEDCNITSTISNAVKGTGDAKVELKNCKIQSTLFSGLVLDAAAKAVLSGCSFHHTFEGIQLLDKSEAILRDSSIDSIEAGISVKQASLLTIDHSQITGGKVGVYMEGGNGSLTDSQIDHSKFGIYLKNGSLSIHRSNISQFKDTGIVVKQSADFDIALSKISGGRKALCTSENPFRSQIVESARRKLQG